MTHALQSPPAPRAAACAIAATSTTRGRREAFFVETPLRLAVVVSLPQVYGRRDRGGSEKKAC